MQDNIFENLFDMVPSKIYAVDVETYDIVYTNKFAQDSLLDFGTKCYENIYGYEQPCAFCKINELKNNDIDTIDFEAFNEADSQWYNLHEKLVTLEDGKIIKYSAGSNITKLKAVQSDYTQTYAELMLKNNEISKLNANLEERVHLEVEKNLKQEKELVEQSKKAEMGQMIGTIAHQLKQPINAMKMTADNIKVDEQLGLDTDLDVLYSRLTDQLSFMNNTIDLFRNFFNPNKKYEEIYLTDVIENTLSIVSDLCVGLDVVLDFRPLTKKVNVLPNELIQVCINIIKNAKEIQEEKDIKDKVIKISVYEENGYQIISINDNAGGVPEDLKEKIFDEYFSTKGEDKGTGIGLNLARQILEDKHDGKIYVENEKFIHNDKEYFGACFFLMLKES